MTLSKNSLIQSSYNSTISMMSMGMTMMCMCCCVCCMQDTLPPENKFGHR